jgi:hypothetical protein
MGPRVMVARTLFRLGWLACLGCCAGAWGCSGSGGDATEAGEESSTGGTAEGPSLAEAVSPSDECSAAPAVAQGRFSGTLRDCSPDPVIGGVCGGGGPDVFLQIAVPLRADLRVEARGNGFTPRVSLAPLGCLAAPMLACGADGIASLTDLAEGTVIDLAVGVDEASFRTLSDVGAPIDGDDPLGFVVDVAMTRVLATGEVCLPAARGRCSSGALCMPELHTVDGDDKTQDDERWVCTDVPANRCDDPEQVTVQLVDDAATLMIDPDQPQTDAHRFSCTGEGTRERVLRLALPASQGPLDGVQYSLQIWAVQPEIGLALRAPGCLASDELDCSPPSPAGSQVTIVAPDELQQAGVQPYLFVELPEPGVLTQPVTLHLRRVLRGPPVGTP